MKRFQKITIIASFIIMSIMFLYALSFSTGMAKGERVGEFFNEMQAFNHQIYRFSFYGLITFGIFLAVGSINKTRYNVLNIVFGLLGSIFMIITSLVAIINLPKLKEGYQALIGSEELNITIIINLSKKATTFVYDIGLFIHIVSLIAGLTALGLVIYKIVERILYDKAYRKQVRLNESTW